MTKYETIIGLEVHVELATKSKIFCGCTTEFGGDPNTHCCPICLGLPGSLPVVNQQAIEYAIKAGLALNCSIANYSKFDRKNYFYPDLTKAYQISQYDQPLCLAGHMDYELDGQTYSVRINRIHVEEEAGKSVHSGDNILGSEFSQMDYNRAGIPLIEIVTEPDIRMPAQAKAFLEQLKANLEYIKVSDCKMEQGSLRCDANISLRPVGSTEFGTKVEIKNLNSFRAIERALEYEEQRQAEVYDQGGTIYQETRTWDEKLGVTVTMRTKEEADDYRYFPDPDLPPLIVEQSWIDEIKATLPELPLARKNRFIEQYKLSDYEASLLTATQELADFFEAAYQSFPNAKELSNWLTGEFARLLNASNLTIPEIPVQPGDLAELLSIVKDGKISGNQGREVLGMMFDSGKKPAQIIKEQGFEQISDTKELEGVIDQILSTYPDEVKRYQAGEDRLLGFFVGQVMKETKGKANPGLVNQIIRNKLLADQ